MDVLSGTWRRTRLDSHCRGQGRLALVLSLAATLGLTFFSTTARADDNKPWLRGLTPPAARPFPSIKPFTGEFGFGWSNIEAARAQATFRQAGARMTTSVSGGTIGFARTLWQLDAQSSAQFILSSLQPISFEQVEKYSRRTTTTKGEFRSDGLWRLRQTVPGPQQKWKKVKVEPIRDMITGMLFVRSQPLRDGDKVRLVVYPGDSPFLTEITVLGRERLTIAGRSFPAIKLDFRPQRIVRNDDGVYQLQPHGKLSRGTVWISDDENRIPLRAEVSIFVGFVYAELKSLRFNDGQVYP